LGTVRKDGTSSTSRTLISEVKWKILKYLKEVLGPEVKPLAGPKGLKLQSTEDDEVDVEKVEV
jgi:hypothetical protein